MSAPLTDKINELITQCNTADGGSDTTLSAAIATLISGYGGGSSDTGSVRTVSGTTYIDSETTEIEITHNLGGIADFAVIWIDLSDSEQITPGTCVMTACIRFQYSNAANIEQNRIIYGYMYKHGTSGNFLTATTSVSESSNTSTTFTFNRGGANWQPNDVNGDPMPYRWIVGRIVE